MLDVTPRPPRLQGDAEVNSNGGRGRAADGVLWVDCLQPEHNFTLTNLRCPCFNTVASITASPAAAGPARRARTRLRYADFANTHARVLDNWCNFCLLIMGILPYCTCHRVYVQIAETEAHSRS